MCPSRYDSDFAPTGMVSTRVSGRNEWAKLWRSTIYIYIYIHGYTYTYMIRNAIRIYIYIHIMCVKSITFPTTSLEFSSLAGKTYIRHIWYYSRNCFTFSTWHTSNYIIPRWTIYVSFEVCGLLVVCLIVSVNEVFGKYGMLDKAGKRCQDINRELFGFWRLFHHGLKFEILQLRNIILPGRHSDFCPCHCERCKEHEHGDDGNTALAPNAWKPTWTIIS